MASMIGSLEQNTFIGSNNMRSTLLPLVLLLSLLGAPSSAAPKASMNPQIEQAVRSYHLLPGYTSKLKVTRVLVSGPYALASWLEGDGGGQAVLKKSGSTWKVLTLGGGQINSAIMVSVGVPKAYADALAAKNR